LALAHCLQVLLNSVLFKSGFVATQPHELESVVIILLLLIIIIIIIMIIIIVIISLTKYVDVATGG